MHDNVDKILIRIEEMDGEMLYALNHGDFETVDRKLRAMYDLNICSSDGWYLIHYVVAKNYLKLVKRLIGDCKVNLNVLTLTGKSPLFFAIERKNNTILRLLLMQGASRYTVESKVLQEAYNSLWIDDDIKEMLLSTWSITWSPKLHYRFSHNERVVAKLVLLANTIAARSYIQEQRSGELNAIVCTYVPVGFQIISQALAKLFQRQKTSGEIVKWTFVPPHVIANILEFALYNY